MPKNRVSPEQEAGYAFSYGGDRDKLSEEAKVIYDQMQAGKYEKMRADTAMPPAKRFPSTVETRRQILETIAANGPKYARPFDSDGSKVSVASFIGTQSWAEYGAVVLQMAILDTLLSIEEKLGKLAGAPSGT